MGLLLACTRKSPNKNVFSYNERRTGPGFEHGTNFKGSGTALLDIPLLHGLRLQRFQHGSFNLEYWLLFLGCRSPGSLRKLLDGKIKKKKY